jgi:hypothetical protein
LEAGRLSGWKAIKLGSLEAIKLKNKLGSQKV